MLFTDSIEYFPRLALELISLAILLSCLIRTPKKGEITREDKSRKTEVKCPVCKKDKLIAEDFNIGEYVRPIRYYCPGCCATYEVGISSDKKYWIGKHKNTCTSNGRHEHDRNDYLTDYPMEEAVRMKTLWRGTFYCISKKMTG